MPPIVPQMVVTTTVRKMTGADLAAVQRIDNECFDEPVNPGKTANWVCPTKRYGALVAVRDESLAGFLVWKQRPDGWEIMRLGVRKPHRRVKVGSDLLAVMRSRLARSVQARVYAHVPGEALSVQKFFSQCGLRAVSVDPHHYGTDRDSYLFELAAAKPARR